MTAKGLKNKGGIARGVIRKPRSINRRGKLQKLPSSRNDDPKLSFPKGTSHSIRRMWKVQACVAALADFNKKQCAIEEERFGTFPDRVVSNVSFKEKPFGDETKHDQDLCGSSVVSLALFDGENMLFACSGITLPRGTTILELTRFVTSACLVREFNEKRNRDDKLRIQVRLPDNTTTDGFMGLYDADIAIVTCIGKLCAHPVDLCLEASPDCPDGHVLAAGRAFSSGGFMAMSGSLSNESPNILLSDGPCFTEAALGGPLVGIDGRFHGMIFDLCHDAGESIKSAKFLSLKSLYDRLELFQILNPKQLHFRGYKLPKGVSSVVPSGFMKTSYRIRSLGYPMPPPLVLELNGKLRNQFEDRFGELRAWKGYPFGDLPNGPRERAWNKLQKEVVTNISRRVVSLASFNRDDTRSFACTGLLISMQRRNSIRTVVLTSASLVRSHDNEDKIDKNLRIEVFLPPNQRCDGTLECYSLHYNIAIVIVKKGFNAIRPENIFISKGMQKPSQNVVAVGRDPTHGLLMAATGKVESSNENCKLDCKELCYCTCKIKKAGIGGPLIGFDGSFVGMNFYDGSNLTPFLPRDKIINVLANVWEIPSERGYNPWHIDLTEGKEENRWPVPEPYWFHGSLDVDKYDVPELIGRKLD